MFQMTNPNPFITPNSDYKRNLDITTNYINSHAKYLSAQTGDPYEQCLEFVKKQSFKGGQFELKNPATLVICKDSKGDRSKVETSLLGFINRVNKQNLTLSPSLTAYLPETAIVSSHSEYIAEGVRNRALTKGEQLRLEGLATPQSIALAKIKKGEQENYKLNNNSYSGAALSEATILFNKSTHPTLTSTCRVATSLSNSNNEKFIMGNRHYYSTEITKANILSICNLTDLDLLTEAMETYDLYWPTPEDMKDVIHYSSKNYIHDKYFTAQILNLAKGLSPIERAAVVYVGDLYHLYQYNKDFVKDMLLGLAKLGDPNDTITAEEFNALDGDTKLLANFICHEQTKGRNHERLQQEEPEVFNYIYGTAKNIIQVLDKYRLLFKAVFMTPNVPHSINAFPSMYRKAVPVSDTDSTMFTLQYWIESIYGEIVFKPETLRLSFALTFLISETVMHLLAIQSANMGVSEKRLRQLAMKNEYFFAMLSLTNRAKHYFASQDGIEGLMLLKARLEIKGVGLRNSKTPMEVREESIRLIKRIINTVKSGKQLAIGPILKNVANWERRIMKSISDGNPEFLLPGTVKDLSGYKNEDNATYAKHEFWKEVFAPSYGEINEPPYVYLSIRVTTDNKTRFKEWVDSLEDRALANRLIAWDNRNGNKGITVHHIPYTVAETHGVPKELAKVADTRTLTFQAMTAFYLILEALGCYFEDKQKIRLISDYY